METDLEMNAESIFFFSRYRYGILIFFLEHISRRNDLYMKAENVELVFYVHSRFHRENFPRFRPCIGTFRFCRNVTYTS